MAQEVYISGATYSAVPGIRLPDSNGNYHEFSDASVTTAVESDVGVGKIFLLADGSIGTGTSQGGGTPSATAHTILFEFADETSATITAYYDSTFISDAIRATTPVTYDSKTVQQASLDGVAWYTRPTETWETLFESADVGYYPESDTTIPPYCWIGELADVYPVVGSVWRITFNGTAYRCVAVNDNNTILIGNPLYGPYNHDDGSDVPCAFYNGGWGAWSGGADLKPYSQQHRASVKIERLVTS